MGRYLRYFLIFIVVIAFVAAGFWIYRSFTGASSADVSVGQPAKVICTADCKDHGQCGKKIEDDNKVVLAGSEPKLTAHDIFFEDEANVAVIAESTKKMTYEQSPNAESEDIKFWQVQEQTEEKLTGWVANWCIQP